MNDTELLTRVATLTAEAAIISPIVVAAVEAIRKRVPFDGWHVLVIAAAVALVLTATLLNPWSSPQIAQAINDAGLVWLMATITAVGGDAWLRKIRGGSQ